MHSYSSANIICSEMKTGFREESLSETVSFEELIMPKDKYTSIFSRRMKAIVYIILEIFLPGKNDNEWLSILCARDVYLSVLSGTISWANKHFPFS